MQRRDFLHVLAGGAGLLLPIGRHAWAASNPAPGPTSRKLIVVMLRGAVDGLSVVAPVRDPHYARLRPTIGLALPGQEGGGLDLDGRFALHPALAPLLPLWQQNKLAFIHASGSPDPSRSHFDAQDYMESATPGRKNTPDGWLNRLLGSLPGPAAPTRAVSIGQDMPRILTGAAPAVNLGNGKAVTRANALDRPVLGAAFDQLYAGHARFGRVYQEGRAAHKAVMSASMNRETQMADGGAPLPNGFPDDAARLGTMMRNDPAIELAFIGLGGWDTHINQGGASGALAGRLAPLGLGLATLAQRLGPVFEDCTIVVMSEFGRTVRENGNRGTDHGHGNVMWVLGGAVAGGKVYGQWQGLAEAQLHEGRDLPVSTDFRAVLAHIGERHLGLSGAQLAKVFPDLPGAGLGFSLLRA
ncbi:MAG: DUF1501 domain-containing protein [Pseudomonadota bacterium]